MQRPCCVLHRLHLEGTESFSLNLISQSLVYVLCHCRPLHRWASMKWHT